MLIGFSEIGIRRSDVFFYVKLFLSVWCRGDESFRELKNTAQYTHLPFGLFVSHPALTKYQKKKKKAAGMGDEVEEEEKE